MAPDPALTVNRGGRLTESQKLDILHAAKVEKKRSLVRFAAYSLLPLFSIPPLFVVVAQAFKIAPALPGLTGGVLAYGIGATFAVRARRRASLAAREAERGDVITVSGVVQKVRYAQARQFRSTRGMFKILVGEHWLMCWGTLADRAARFQADGVEAHAYYLPRSQWLVNLEASQPSRN